MKRLTRDQVVSISVGDDTIDCRVVRVDAGEVAVAPVLPAESGLLPAASAGATLVFSHGGRLVMLRGAMYRAAGRDDIRFAEMTSRPGAAPAVAEQRRKAARLPIRLPATITPIDADGAPMGEERRLVTRDISIGGFAVDTGVVSLGVAMRVRFELVLSDGAMIGGTARVARAASEMSGLAFEDLPPLERVRLAGFLAAQQTHRTARPVAAAAPAR
jgi:c-di-GMP-binding flagellar brake protein YcgR